MVVPWQWLAVSDSATIWPVRRISSSKSSVGWRMLAVELALTDLGGFEECVRRVAEVLAVKPAQS